jgi:hypothetical protein
MKTGLQAHPEDDVAAELSGIFSPAEIRELDTFADGIQKIHAHPARSEDAKRAGWHLLERSMDTEPVAHKWSLFWRLAAVPAFMFLALFGVVALAQTSLPGDPTYGIKRGTESVQLTLASSDTKKADMCSMFMKRRANELAQLPAGTTNSAKVVALTASIKEEAQEFSQFADNAGDNRNTLRTQRTRDAQYVIEALKISQGQQTDQQSQQAITKTIADMSSIVANAS